MSAPEPTAGPRVRHKPDVLVVLAALLADEPEAKQGQMFGVPAFFTAGKLFACVYGGQVGLKLPEDRVRDLTGQPGFVQFRPYGKPMMREWIAIERPNADEYAGDGDLLLESMRFVQAQAARPGDKPRRGKR